MSKSEASAKDKYKVLVKKENECICMYLDEEKMMGMIYKDLSQKNEKNNFICTCSYIF